MAMPMWSSTLKIFFWYDDSSLAERLSAASTTKSLDRSPSAAAPYGGVGVWVFFGVGECGVG